MPRTRRAKTDDIEENHPEVTIPDSQPDAIAEDLPETGDRPNEDGPSASRRIVCKRKQPDEEEISTLDDRPSHSSRIGDGRSNSSEVQQENTPRIRSLSPDPVELVRRMLEDERTARMLQAQFDAEIVPQSSSYVDHHFSTGHNSVISIDDSEDDDIDPSYDYDSDDSQDDSDDSPFVFSMNRRGRGVNYYNLRSRGSLVANHVSLDSDDEDDYDDGEILLRGLSQGEINRLRTRKYTHPNSASSSSRNEATHKRIKLTEECVVCLADYKSRDVLRMLPCCHEFHACCIDPWLRKKQTCPVCRLIVDSDRLVRATGNI